MGSVNWSIVKPLSGGESRRNGRQLVRFVLCTLAFVCLVTTPGLHAQTPVAIPQTATLLAGGATSGGTGISGKTLPAQGAACFTGSPLTATDSYGDGCPGPYTQFSTDFRGGVYTDGSGNVYVIESTEGLVRKIDARTGVVTAVTGTSTSGCTTNNDGYGDGCPFAETKLASPRGGWVDPYGNVLIAGYNSDTVNILCNAVSPLCPNTSGRKQVGSMYRIAGCVTSATSAGSGVSGTTAGTAGDGGLASPNGNLSGDASDWGASGSTAYGSCTGGLNQPRGVAADKFGNVYIADTGNERWRVVVGPATFTLPNGTVLTNPLANIIALDPTYSSITPSSAYGHIYPIMGGFTSSNNGGTTPPTAAGTACAGSGGGSTLDTIGDGCPFYEGTNGSSTSSTLGVSIDAEGNPIFLDQNNKVVQVLYLSGSLMASAIQKANNNSSLAITPGYLYPLIGLGGASGSGISYTPTLGTATAINSNGSRMAVDPNGNLYFSDFGKNSVYMLDMQTGYARNVLVAGTPCETSGTNYDSVGDGCSGTLVGTAATPFTYGAGNSMGIAFDPHGNLILGDIGDSLIRRIDATDLAPVQVGTSLTQQDTFHLAAGATGMTAALTAASPDITVGSVTCGSANADNTLDCQVPVTFAPTAPGARSALLTVTPAGAGTAATFPVSGVATGSALVADAASPVVHSVGTVSSASLLASDGAGNVFALDSGAGAFLKITSTGTTTTLGGTVPSTPFQMAVDNEDSLYIASGGASVTKVTQGTSGTYTSAATSYTLPANTYAATQATLTTTPQIYGIAVDSLGNIYFSDRANEAVFEVPVGADGSLLNEIVPVITGFSSVGQLALDGNGNLFIADPGAGKVYRLLVNTPLYPTPTVSSASVIAASVNPSQIAVDTAGDLYVADDTAMTVTEYPASGATATVYTASAAPTGLSVDGTGIVYESEAGLTALHQIARNALAYTFPNKTTTLPLTLSNVGNLAATGTASTDNAEFPFTTGATDGCGTVPSTSNPLLPGAACTTTAGFNPGNNGQFVSSVVSLLPASYTVGAVTLSGQEPTGVTYTTTTTVSGPSSATYAASGTEITFTVTESASNSTSQNGESINVSIDNGTATPYTIASGQVSVPVSGLTAGSHTILATYPGDGTYLASNNSANFTITQAATSVSWTPATTTLQYSAALGSNVLDATSGAAGVFIYTATPSGGGTTVNVHSASYLAIGSYTLGVTFVPNDSVDYASSTATVSNFTVTQASTTAALGTTQMLVASDGTGNYETVQEAVNALPNGGSVYIKPGTYNGFITVVQPDIALRGLGGDPTKVILTHEAGAFGSTYPYTGEFTAANSNGAQLPSGSTVFTGDNGSATLVVEKGINAALSGSTQTPNNFYAENLSLVNTYDTDTTTQTTTYETSSNGTCTTNAGAPMTYNALYNAGTLCASQALAIAITGDLAVMNNVYTTSLQDTIYAASAGSGSNGYVPSREYWFRGKVTGDVDYIFGDAAAVFDHSSIYTAWHGSTATGTETIQAQQQKVETGSAGAYLSGYVMNSDVFTSQSTGMTNLYFGRPYGTYSTWVMLNSYVDQVNPTGYTTGLGPSLVDATYAEYNDMTYTDPSTGSADLNGIAYLGTGGNTGEGVSGPRETSSTNPGTAMADNTIPTSPTEAQAQAYYPDNFLGQTVPSAVASGTQNWVPTATLASEVNAFVPSGTSATVAAGSSVTILMRPQTPGLGAVANGTWTIPTGTYTLSDSVNGGTATVIASGSLDASGEAYYTTSSLAAGTHDLTWTYSGDANFASSTTSSAYVLTVTGGSESTTTSVSSGGNITYGQSASATVTVSSSSGTPTGNVTLNVDGTAVQTAALASGSATFSLSGLSGGSHTLTASYAGSSTYAVSSTASGTALLVSPATLTVTGACANRVFDEANSCSATVSGYQYFDSAATVFSAGPTSTTNALRTSPAGNYTATPSYTLSAAGSADYTVNAVNGSFTVSGGAPQSIIFLPLPNFPPGTYQLAARTTSGLGVTYQVTAGSASVSGSTLTVTGAGTVTVEASSATDPTGDYAAATAVSQSFTAQ